MYKILYDLLKKYYSEPGKKLNPVFILYLQGE